MGGRDIIVVGASAGGLRPLQTLLSSLPASLPAAVFVVLHRAAAKPVTPTKLLFPNAAPLVRWAADGERFYRGHVYMGVPDHHLLVERGRIRLERGPKEPSRPSIDTLFRSAALGYGRRVVGVVLSGMLHDGTAGLWQIKKCGGVTIVQDPLDAQFPAMVQNALANVPIDHCLPAREIGRRIVELASGAPPPPPLFGPRAAKVLIVEDERIVALNLERRLCELGYEVSGSTGCGEAAMALAERYSPR